MLDDPIDEFLNQCSEEFSLNHPIEMPCQGTVTLERTNIDNVPVAEASYRLHPQGYVAVYAHGTDDDFWCSFSYDVNELPQTRNCKGYIPYHFELDGIKSS